MPEPEFSILALGRHLGALQQQSHLLDVLRGRVGNEAEHAPLDERRLRQRHVKLAREAVDRHADAIEAAVLTGRATSTADALVQLLVASSRIDRLANGDAEDIRDDHEQVANAMESAIRAIALEARIRLAGIGGRFFANAWSEVWPDVDTTPVQSEVNAEIDRAIDEGAGRPGVAA